MPEETIALRDARLVIHDGVAHFTHLRPERRNPMSLELRLDYVDMLDRVEGACDVRALVISGSGGAFCAGGDLKGMKDRAEQPDAAAHSPDATRRRLLALHAWAVRLRNLEMPVIAAVDGAAVGAGMALALLADFVLASERAFFSMSFVKVGLLPDMAATYLLPRVVGMAAAKDLVLTGRRLAPGEAKAMGIVHSIHASASLDDEALRLARRFTAAPAQALGPAKRLLNASFETPYAALVELEASAQAVATTSAYHAQALQRFAGGEPLPFDWDRMP